jgi:hypothetical protein
MLLLNIARCPALAVASWSFPWGVVSDIPSLSRFEITVEGGDWPLSRSIHEEPVFALDQ